MPPPPTLMWAVMLVEALTAEVLFTGLYML